MSQKGARPTQHPRRKVDLHTMMHTQKHVKAVPVQQEILQQAQLCADSSRNKISTGSHSQHKAMKITRTPSNKKELNK